MTKQKTEKILKQVQNDKSVETGRSMTEMLGVLAIIGVLSVGSIAGYRYAMDKYRANELLSGASERAVLVTAQITADRRPSLAEFSNNETAGGTFATDADSVRVYSDGIGIKVLGVKGAVCKNLIKATEDTEVSIVNTSDRILSEEDCDDENDNTLIITFESGIGNGETGNDICASEIVKIYDCEAKKVVNCCPDNGNRCRWRQCRCSNNDDCFGEQVCSDGLCDCPMDGYDETGAPSRTDPSVCCWFGRAWDGSDYHDLNIKACGCPDSGTQSKTDPSVCCGYGVAWNEDKRSYYDLNIKACGCPAGYSMSGSYGIGTLSESGVCCQDGYAWNENSWQYDLVNTDACGS